MDGRLRNGLWTAIHDLFQRLETGQSALLQAGIGGLTPLWTFLERLWIEFLGAARDQFIATDPVPALRIWFYGVPWNTAYDLIEYIAAHAEDEMFEESCNHVLTRELAPYRLVQGQIIELTDGAQVAAINDSVAATSDISPVNKHLRTALDRLADRPEPDCRNAMKEAISAVETLARLIAGTSGTLADALKTIERGRKIALHPALNDAWQRIYGYTSDEGGVRHGLKGDSKVGLAEATYMVVTCSAIVSYLLELANRQGITLEKGS
jgi:hypothetical protein